MNLENSNADSNITQMFLLICINSNSSECLSGRFLTDASVIPLSQLGPYWFVFETRLAKIWDFTCIDDKLDVHFLCFLPFFKFQVCFPPFVMLSIHLFQYFWASVFHVKILFYFANLILTYLTFNRCPI